MATERASLADVEFTLETRFGLRLVERIAQKVGPVYGIRQKDIPISQISHDFQYLVDDAAEKEIKTVFQDAWVEGSAYGYITEDQGLVLPPSGNVELIFVIDPVDGSRSAQSGAESACVTLAGVRNSNNIPNLGDIEFGLSHAIKENHTFVVDRNEGVFEKVGETYLRLDPRLNPPTELKDAFVVSETSNVSAVYTGVILDPLLRATHIESRFPSASYAGLSIVRGMADIWTDVRLRLVRDYPHLKTQYSDFLKVVTPLDIASVWLMIEKLGGKITDAYGNPLNDVQLWKFNPDGSWGDTSISVAAAVTPDLHKKAMEKLEEGFTSLNPKT